MSGYRDEDDARRASLKELQMELSKLRVRRDVLIASRGRYRGALLEDLVLESRLGTWVAAALVAGMIAGVFGYNTLPLMPRFEQAHSTASSRH